MDDPSRGMVLSSAPSAPSQQRIYVGGIDPHRGLTVAEVWARLQARLLEEGMPWSERHEGRCYLQCTVATKATTSPLTLIKSWFHHVTWKGCKLVVEEARPHFLLRLHDERTRPLPQSLPETDTSSPVTVTADRSAWQPPRHWRIQRGSVGAPVRYVDTQPGEVTSWALFTRLRQRHQAYQEKQQKAMMAAAAVDGAKRRRAGDPGLSLKEALKQAYYDRAIRLRFPEEDGLDAMTTDRATNWIEELLDKDDTAFAVQHREASDASIVIDDDPKTTRGRYVWSDSEDEEEEDAMDREDGPVVMAPAMRPPRYEWSDDDTSEEDRAPDASWTRVPTDLGEFESAILTNRTRPPSNSEPWTFTEEGGVAHDPVDLTRDVARNLQILAQLFPDRFPTATALPAAEVNTHSAAPSEPPKPAPSAPSRTGWDAAGQMLRFDPSLPQSRRLLVLDPAAVDTMVEKEERQNLPSNTETEPETMVTKPSETNDVTVASVYEQKKLEQVFKEVREATSVVASHEGGASFSFGFDLGAASALTGESSAFTAKDPERFEMNTAPSTVPMDTEDDKDVVDHQNSTFPLLDPRASRPRYRAFDFPNEEMRNECVRHFYFDIHDGARIINDREGWYNDPTVKDTWMKERFALTQDWKRKRKYAFAKKQKRSQQSALR
jgi:hypothetical protein